MDRGTEASKHGRVGRGDYSVSGINASATGARLPRAEPWTVAPLVQLESGDGGKRQLVDPSELVVKPRDDDRIQHHKLSGIFTRVRSSSTVLDG